MANAGSRVSIEGETMRYAEYNSQSKIRSETEIDKRLVSIYVILLFEFLVDNKRWLFHRPAAKIAS